MSDLPQNKSWCSLHPPWGLGTPKEKHPSSNPSNILPEIWQAPASPPPWADYRVQSLNRLWSAEPRTPLGVCFHLGSSAKTSLWFWAETPRDTFGANFLSLHSAKMQAVLRESGKWGSGKGCGGGCGVRDSWQHSFAVSKPLPCGPYSTAQERWPMGPRFRRLPPRLGAVSTVASYPGPTMAAEICPSQVVRFP